MTNHFDLIIVGAGPGGLCAAMYAGRGMLNAVVLERAGPGGELLNTEKVEDYPGFESILGRELAERMASHARKFGADIRHGDGGVHHPAGGRHLRGPAPGRKPSIGPPRSSSPPAAPRPSWAFPGETEYAGRGVSYCAVCDGAFFRGETIAVVGGGDAAVEEADYLTRYAEKVYVIHRRDAFRASKLLQERLFANPKIEVIWNTRVLEATGRAIGADGPLDLENTSPASGPSFRDRHVRLHRVQAQHRAHQPSTSSTTPTATSSPTTG